MTVIENKHFELKNSIAEEIAIYNANWDGDRRKLIALTYIGDANYEVGILPNDVIIFNEDADILESSIVMAGDVIQNPMRAIKLERSYYTDAELKESIIK